MKLPLYCVLVRPHLEYRVQTCGPQCRRNVDLLERVQRRVTETIQGMEHLCYEADMEHLCYEADMEHLCYEDRLRELGLFSLQKRRLQSDLFVT